MKNKIKQYYENGYWTEKMVRDAVIKGKITADDFREITGKEYYKILTGETENE